MSVIQFSLKWVYISGMRIVGSIILKWGFTSRIMSIIGPIIDVTPSGSIINTPSSPSIEIILGGLGVLTPILAIKRSLILLKYGVKPPHSRIIGHVHAGGLMKRPPIWWWHWSGAPIRHHHIEGFFIKPLMIDGWSPFESDRPKAYNSQRGIIHQSCFTCKDLQC